MANSTATANIIVTANTQGAKSIVDLFNETKRGLNQTTQAHKHAAGAAKEHSISIVDLAAKLYLVQVGLRNVVKAIEAAYDFAKLGATVEQTAISFERVITNAGQTVNMLNQLRAAAKGTVSDVGLMQMTNQALVGTTGEFKDAMAAALPQVLEMARASAILNPQLGTTEHQFDRLTLGLKRLEPRILDDIGLELRLTQVNKEYADQVGKSVDALTVEERSFALLNAVLAKHNDYVKLAGDNAESAIDPYERLGASAKNLWNNIAQELNPSMSHLIDALNDTLNIANELVDSKLGELFFGAISLVIHGFAVELELLNRGLEQLQDWRPPTALIDFLLTIPSIDPNVILLKVAAQAYKDLRNEAEHAGRAMQNYRTNAAQVSLDALKQQSEEEKKWVQKKEKTLDDMFLLELKNNERLTDARDEVLTDLLDLDDTFEKKLSKIKQDAEDDRSQLAIDAAEDRLNIEKRYNDRIADAYKDLADLKAELEGKDPFISEETQRKLDEAGGTVTDLKERIRKLRDEMSGGSDAASKNLERQISQYEYAARTELDPGKKKEIEQYIVYLRRELELRKQNLEDEKEFKQQQLDELEEQLRQHEAELNTIEKDAREEERQARIQARIAEKEEQIAAFEADKQEELNALQTKLDEKLKISIDAEKKITDETNLEWTKRHDEISTKYNELIDDIKNKYQEAMLDAMLSLVPASSEAARAFMEMKFKLHGATEDLIEDNRRNRDSLNLIIDGINLVSNVGFGTFFGMQGVVAGLNGQLWYTKYLLDQLGVAELENINVGGTPRRQHGGPVSANRPYIVGEAGPELFVPQGGGNIVPNDRMGGGGASVSITINATAFQGSQADAIKFGNWVAPIVLQYMDRFGGNANAVGAKRIRSG